MPIDSCLLVSVEDIDSWSRLLVVVLIVMGLQLLWSRAFTTLEIDHFRAPKSSKIFSAREIPPPPLPQQTYSMYPWASDTCNIDLFLSGGFGEKWFWRGREVQKDEALSVTDLLCMSQTNSAYSICHRLTLSATYLLCLPHTYSVVTDLLCHFQTYSAWHRLILFVTDLLCLSQTYTVTHSVLTHTGNHCHSLTYSVIFSPISWKGNFENQGMNCFFI